MLGGLAGLDPVLPRELERRLDRLRAAAQEIELVEVRRQQRSELVGQGLDGFIGKGGAVDVRDLRGLVRHRLPDLGNAVAEVGDEGAAGTIQDTGGPRHR